MRPTLFLDIEAVPDAALAQRVSGVKGDGTAALAAVAPPKNEFEAHGFPKPLYHQVVAISIGLTEPDGTVSTLRSVGALDADERTLLERFWGGFATMSRKNARVVSWNGRGYDLPVLVQRGLLHGIDVSAYLSDANYQHRFRDDHLDLMDWFSVYRSSPQLKQDEMAHLLGVPGKLGVDGGDVEWLVAKGDLETVRQYCTCDVATLALIYARLGPSAGWFMSGTAQKMEQSVLELMQEVPLWNSEGGE